jgi:hypothetical protein
MKTLTHPHDETRRGEASTTVRGGTKEARSGTALAIVDHVPTRAKRLDCSFLRLLIYHHRLIFFLRAFDSVVQKRLLHSPPALLCCCHLETAMSSLFGGSSSTSADTSPSNSKGKPVKPTHRLPRPSRPPSLPSTYPRSRE